MVDYAIDVYRELLDQDVVIPKEMIDQKQKIISSQDEIPHNSKVSKNQNSWIFLT